jgi:SAM-dependent methyltransferase
MRVRHLYGHLYRWAAERLYHELAWAYELVAWVVSFGHWHQWRVQVLDYVVGSRVLELGFGTGRLLAAAADAGYSVWGIDPSREMHRVARRRLLSYRIPRAVAVAESPPFRDGSFDTVLVTFPTGYILSPGALDEVSRLLSGSEDRSKSGRLIVTGLGFRTDSFRLGGLLRWLFGGGTADAIDWFSEYAEARGFHVDIVDNADTKVRVPILILERG